MAFSTNGEKKNKKCIWVKYGDKRASLAQGFQTAWPIIRRVEFSTSVIVLLLLCQYQPGSTPRQGVFSIPTKGP